MSRRQLFFTYLFVLFMMIYGFDLINHVKFNTPIDMGDIVHPFVLSQLIYATITLLLTRWIFIRLTKRRQYAWLPLAVVGLILGFILIRYSIEEIIFPFLINVRNYPEDQRLTFYILDNVYYAIIYVVLGIGIYLLDMQFRNQQMEAELLQKNKEAELQFLRSQFNPHFLFNTLNNIYSLVYEKSDRAPAAMLQLSDLMRYLLYEKKEQVPVAREWQYIGNFITLQKLRFDYEVPLLMRFEPGPSEAYIAPYLLIPFIENAFKHADFRDPLIPLNIKLVVTPEGLTFTSSNKISQQEKDQLGGVGLENVRRRLELLYPGKHRLNINSNNRLYQLTLSIKF